MSAAPITRAPGKVFDAISHLDDRPLVGGRRAYSSGIATAPLRDRGLPLALTPCKAGASPFFILPTDRRRASLGARLRRTRAMPKTQTPRTQAPSQSGSASGRDRVCTYV